MPAEINKAPTPTFGITTITILILSMMVTARCGGGGGGSDDSYRRQQRIDKIYHDVRVNEAMEQWRKAPKE